MKKLSGCWARTVNPHEYNLGKIKRYNLDFEIQMMYLAGSKYKSASPN
jgi:hypothetical protein